MNWEQLLCTRRSRQSRGGGEADLRSPFEKDYQRIIISPSFRRLQDKTQVFPLDQSDFVRTRLTHSLEVSSFAKSLGQKVCATLMQERPDFSPTPQQASQIEDVLLCAGLLHDIGNPPFGHFGETTIRSYFEKAFEEIEYKGRLLGDWLTEQMRADFCRFEGNAQALRLLSKLHFIVDEHGMNLTFAVLSSIIKYPISSLDIDKNLGISHKKMGYFWAERELFLDICEALGTLKQVSDNFDAPSSGVAQMGFPGVSPRYEAMRHPLTFLLEAADDIAYTTADIEDAYRKHMISYAALKEALIHLLEKEEVKSLPASQYRALTQLVQSLEDKLKDAEEKGYVEAELFAVRNWLIACQTLLLNDVSEAFVEEVESIMSGRYEKALGTGRVSGFLISLLGDLARREVFESKMITRMEIAADVVLTYLLDRFVRAALYFGEAPQVGQKSSQLSPIEERLMRIVSENYRYSYQVHAAGKSETERLYLRLMLITDFICGMTDSYARNLYLHMTGAEGF